MFWCNSSGSARNLAIFMDIKSISGGAGSLPEFDTLPLSMNVGLSPLGKRQGQTQRRFLASSVTQAFWCAWLSIL